MKVQRRKTLFIVLMAFLLFPQYTFSAGTSETRKPTDILADWLKKYGATDIQAEMNRTRLASSAYRALAREFSTGSKTCFTGEQYCNLLYEEQEKVAVLYLATLKECGITVKKGPEYYAGKLDEFYNDNPGLKKESCTLILKTLVIMEYDWAEPDCDRDLLARQWLGDELCAENRKRFRN